MSSTVTEITRHQQYHSAGLDEQDLEGAEPLELFKRWFEDAQRSGLVEEPEAMCLSTALPTGEVSSRFVLLKKIEPPTGLVFFTNYDSRKAQELLRNPHVSVAFYWGPLHQQIRICGKAEKISPHESQLYFDGRPLGSRIGAWASPQSSPLDSRTQLLDLVAKHETQFAVQPGSIDRDPPSEDDLKAHIPRPDYWGGFRIIPNELEFWVGRPNRLHDRFVFKRTLDGMAPSSPWTRQRLAP
jgi:pyridoxamine-phosphate oxidase